MQFTFIILYVFYYLITLWVLLTIIVLFLPLFFYAKYSFNSIFSFVKIYTNWTSLIYTSFFFLAGLPPVGIFFLKLNFLIYLLNYWFIFFILYIFILLFCNMLFYLTIFKYRINWSLIASTLISSILKSLESSAHNNSLVYSSLLLIKYGTIKVYYNLLYIIFSIFFLLFFNLFFFTDIYIIIYNFFL